MYKSALPETGDERYTRRYCFTPNFFFYIMENSKPQVLITGCSDRSLGAALAIAFHNVGLHVYVTARNLANMSTAAFLGIKTLELDVTSSASIVVCASKLSSFDILVNNAGAHHLMPVADLDLDQARATFNINVCAQLAITRPFSLCCSSHRTAGSSRTRHLRRP